MSITTKRNILGIVGGALFLLGIGLLAATEHGRMTLLGGFTSATVTMLGGVACLAKGGWMA